MNPTVLVVDDKINIQILLTEVLTQHGYNVVCASNGKEGLYKLAINKPAIILLDIMMPQMDGFTLAKEIRRSNKQVPIIFLTAKSQKLDKTAIEEIHRLLVRS